jgi:H+/gluconate symporter-like permease
MLTSSVAFSAVIMILAVAVLVWLSMRNIPMWLGAIVAAMIIGICTSEGPLGILFGTFSNGVSMMVANLGIVYLMGMIFADALTTSGCGDRIGTFLMDKLSVKAAPFCIMIPTLLLAFGGIGSYPFIMAPICFAVLKKANLPRMVGVVILCGSYSLIGFLIPGTTLSTNVLAANLFGTTLFAGADVGIIMFVVGVVLNILYYIWLCNDCRKKGIGYTPTELEKESGERNSEDAPSFIMSVIPLLIAFVGSFIFQLGLGFNSNMTAVCAQGLAVIFIYATNWKRMTAFNGNKLMQLANSMKSAFAPLMIACFVMGFSMCLSQTAIYQQIAKILTGLNGNPYVVTVIAIMILACIMGAPTTAITTFAPGIGATLIARGADASLIHRLAMAAGTTFDSMPWSVSLILNFQVLGVTLKEAYKNVIVVQIVITTIYTLVGLAYVLIFH